MILCLSDALICSLFLIVFWRSELIISKFWSTIPRTFVLPRVLGRE